MGLLINKSDFVGRYALDKSVSDKIDAYILEFEKKHIYDLLGKELADLLLADLVLQVPQTQRFIDLVDEISFVECNRLYYSFGLKKILLSVVWFYYTREIRINAGQNGSVINQSETAKSDIPMTFIFGRYNEGIDSYNTVQRFCVANILIYPEFLGVVKQKSAWV